MLLLNDLQRTPGMTIFLLNWHIKVIHGPKSNCPANSFAGQGIFQQLQSIHFDLDIQISQPVAFRTRITVNGLVLAAPVQIHVVLQAKTGIWLLDMIEDGLGRDFSNHRRLGSLS